MRKYKKQIPEEVQYPDENENNEIFYKKYVRNNIQFPPPINNYTQGKIDDFDYENGNITKGKEIKSPEKENDDDDLYEDLGEKNIDDDFDIENDDIPLMRVRKMSLNSKEIGKIRRSLKLKKNITDVEKEKENGPLIDETKAKIAAENYFKKRKNFLNHRTLNTQIDIRRNKLTLNNFSPKNEEKEKPNIYITNTTRTINKGGNYVNKNKIYIFPNYEMKKFSAEEGKVEKKEKEEEKMVYNRRKNLGRYNTFSIKKEDDETQKNLANKYAKMTKNNDDYKTLNDEKKSFKNNFYQRVKTSSNKNNEINNDKLEKEQNNKYNYRRGYKINDKEKKEEESNKKIYIRKTGYKEMPKNDVMSGYRKRYTTRNIDNNKNEFNQTEITTNRKTKLENEDKKNKYSGKNYGKFTENKEESPINKVSIRKRFTKKIEIENNNDNNEKDENKKIVVNTNSGFSRWKRY